MKWLAVDYGDSRTGLAGCDAGETITSPITPQIEEKSMNKVAAAVTEVFAARGAEGLVCGLPKNMDGTEGSRANKSRRFAQRLANTAGVPVVLWDERRTTVSAAAILADNDTFGAKRKERLGVRCRHSGELSELARPPPGRGAARAGPPRSIKRSTNMPNANEPRFPTHVAIIVDGNRRWAKQRMLPVSMGHKAGFDRLREITRYAVGDRGVFVLSLYVFSTENFSRDAKEVGYLMDLFANNFRTIADEMNERGCKVLFSGRREGLQQRVLDAMDYMMDLTKDNEKGIVNFCLNYGSHAELTDATRAIAAEVKAGTLEPEAIDEKVIEKHLYRDLPPVDLMIRTSGEERLSNFLLWQCAYAEFYFTPTLFPDFTKECFDKALAEYARRDRRMGGNTKK